MTTAITLLTAGVARAGTLEPSLAEAVRRTTAGGEFAVIVRLRDKVDHAVLKAAVARDARPARLARVIRTLRGKAEQTQQGVRQFLAEKERGGSARGTKAFWIFNGFALTATADVVRELAARSDVETVTPDRVLTLRSTASAPAPITTTWNLTKIGAQTAWNAGFIGQGVVVGSMDTGVDLTHPALKAKWRGGSNSWFDPYKNSATPYDADGHGTGTMGVMVAGNITDNPVGIAPGAMWIAAKIFDDQGNAPLSSIHAAFQWMLDPDGDPATSDAPDVVNNSWDLGNTGLYDGEFAPDIQSLNAAGIAVVFSAGNEGAPLPSQSNTSTSPGNNPGAFAVGATDTNDVVTYFSSRGPSPYDGSIFPALVAPGIDIRSTDLNGRYSMFTNNGTSYSAPHVSGAIALLLSGRPVSLVDNPVAQENALVAAAYDLGPTGADNAYGYGRLDVAKAVSQLALQPPKPTGDANGDGVVDLQDALLVLQAAIGLMPLTPTIMQQGDVAPLLNGIPHADGKIDVLDALTILRKVVGELNF